MLPGWLVFIFKSLSSFRGQHSPRYFQLNAMGIWKYNICLLVYRPCIVWNFSNVDIFVNFTEILIIWAESFACLIFHHPDCGLK